MHFHSHSGIQQKTKITKRNPSFASLGICFWPCSVLPNLEFIESTEIPCLWQHRRRTKSKSIDFGIWPNWWYHYVDRISLSLIKMVYVEPKGRGRLAWRKERRGRNAISKDCFLSGRLASVFKHYVVTFQCLPLELNFISLFLSMLMSPNIWQKN